MRLLISQGPHLVGLQIGKNVTEPGSLAETPCAVVRRSKLRHAEAKGLEEAVVMAGYETAGYNGYHSAATTDFYYGTHFSVATLRLVVQGFLGLCWSIWPPSLHEPCFSHQRHLWPTSCLGEALCNKQSQSAVVAGSLSDLSSQGGRDPCCRGVQRGAVAGGQEGAEKGRRQCEVVLPGVCAPRAQPHSSYLAPAVPVSGGRLITSS